MFCSEEVVNKTHCIEWPQAELGNLMRPYCAYGHRCNIFYCKATVAMTKPINASCEI